MSSTTNQPGKRVLLTGSAGDIGRAICPALTAQGHFVRGFDQRTRDDLAVDEQITADLTDQQALHEAASGMDVMIHLAAFRSPGDFHEKLLNPNVIGLFNAMDAAREQGIKRVILASTVQVISGYPDEAPRPVPTDVRLPTNHYALAKVWAEDMGEMYARVHGMEVIVARIGWFPANPKIADKFKDKPPRPSILEPYLSHDDARRFFTAAVNADISAEPSRFHVLYAMGPGYHGPPTGDPDPARRVIGYQAQDPFPRGLPFEIPGYPTPQ